MEKTNQIKWAVIDLHLPLFNGKLIASRIYQNLSRTQIIQACKSEKADACTQLIFLNNWEIPDDYPW